MLDIERAQPALLAHGEGYEITDLDQFGLAEVLVQPRPELVVDRQIPGDRLGIGERGLLLFAILRGSLEIDQVAIVVLDDPLARGFNGALIAAIFAFDRAGDINTAEFLDGMVGDAVLENVAPAIGE